MVEPQQVIVAHRAEIGEAPRDRRRILRNRIAARCRAIEADAARVGAVVIGRVPFGTIEIADPRRGAVMMAGRHRSEEHTSELQSLMRISYAVFCLKKKTKTTIKSEEQI